jgi:NitT/TauT family transport system substrate-binding protein
MLHRSNRILLLFAALLLVLTAAQCVTPVPQVIEKEVVVTREVEKQVFVEPDYVTFRTNWLFSGIHAWVFYGREKGFFKEQNIVLDIREGNGSGNVVRTVINKGDDFALVSTGNPIVSIAQGAPIKLIYTWIGAFNWGYLCRPESGVKVAKDLEGKIIVSSPGNAGLNYHPLFIQRAGLDPAKMQDLTLVDAGAMVSTVLAGKADCELGGVADHLPYWIKEGKEPVVIYLESPETGVWGPATGAITHQDMINNNPDLVKRMVAALYKSQVECEKDVEGCVQALLNAHPMKDKDTETLALKISMSTWYGPNQKCLGQFVPENWEAAINLIRNAPESPIKDDTKPVEAFFDASFLPPCEK